MATAKSMTNAERLANWLESARTAICQSRCDDVRRRFSGGIISTDFAESILRELQAAERLREAVEGEVHCIGYLVNNPSAWGAFDQDASNAIAAGLKHLSAALSNYDEVGQQ